MRRGAGAPSRSSAAVRSLDVSGQVTSRPCFGSPRHRRWVGCHDSGLSLNVATLGYDRHPAVVGHWSRMNAPGWGGLRMRMGVASLVVFQVAEGGGVAVLEVEDHSPVGADRDRPEPDARADVAQITAVAAAQVDKRERAVELI